MRFLTFLLPFLVACAAVQPGIRAERSSVEAMVNSVVGLVTFHGDAYCSGVQLEEGVLTAAHCVDAEPAVLVGPRSSYDPYTGSWTASRLTRVLRVDVEADLALVNYHGLHPAPVGPKADVGDPIWAIGHPGSYGYTVHRGIVSSETRYSGSRPWQGVDAGLLPGMSGGPIFNDSGEVVCLVSFMLIVAGEPQPHLGGCIPASEIQRFLSP